MKRIVFAALIACNVYGSVTISSLNQYAANLQEYPKSDNTNWVTPDFTSYYTSIRPNLLKAWFRANTTAAAVLQSALKNVTAQRKEYTGRLVIKLTCKPESKLYIWGDLHGAFHSLVRDLNWLIEKKVLNKRLQLKSSNDYFIFNGDAIDRSPHNIETLIAVLSLMQQNPTQVIYLRGKHEDRDYWSNFDLKEELKIRAAHISNQTVPLEHELNTFFNTLPLALYVTVANSQEFIRISHTDRDNPEIKEASFSAFLNTPQKAGLTSFDITHVQKSDDKTAPDIIAIIKAENWQREFKAHNGLGSVDQDQGATAWTTFSSPTQAHQEYLKFSNDAFGLLTIKKPLKESTINSYYHDAKEAAGAFKKSETFNIATALLATESNINDIEKTLNIGSTMALVQGVPVMGQRTKRGLNLRIDQENNNGGVHGIHLRTIIYNDNYTPALARNNIERLMKRDKTDIILLPVGSPTLDAYLDYIEKKEIAVLFPITGGAQFRKSKYKGLIHYRGSYDDEVHALIDYMVTDQGARKFALFYQNDAYGKGPLQAAHEELKNKGITSWLDVPYQRNSVNFKEQAEKIKEYQPDAIGLFSTAQSTIELVRQIGVDFLTNKQLFGISFLAEESFRRFMRQSGLPVLFGAVVPNPKTSDLAIVKEYRAEMDKDKYGYDVFSLEAYIATSILIDALTKIDGPITKDKVIAQLESIKNYNFKGLTLNFNPERRDLARTIWLETGDDVDWVQKDIHTIQRKEDSHGQDTDSSGPDSLAKKPTSPASQPLAS